MFKSQLYLLLAVGSRFRIWLYHPHFPGAGGLKKEGQVTWNRTSSSSKGALHWIIGKYLLRRLMKIKGWGLWVRAWGLWGSEWPLFNQSVSLHSFKFSVFPNVMTAESLIFRQWGLLFYLCSIECHGPIFFPTPQSTNEFSQVTTKPKASKDWLGPTGLIE